MHPTLTPALDAGRGVLRRRDHPHLVNHVDAAVRNGGLVRLLPGVYTRPPDASRVEVRARAACLADPAAVVTGDAAAFLLGWQATQPGVVSVATLRLRTPHPGYRWERRSIPERLSRRVDGYRVTTKAMTALDLAAEHDDVLEFALRHGVRPDELRLALTLTPHRRGNRARRRGVRDMVSQPWSVAERRAHAALRRGRISGWQANRAVYDRHGQKLGYGDLVWEESRLIIEIDGATHRSPEGMARDAARDLAFARAGWEVVRVPASLVLRDPAGFAALVREVLSSRTGRRRAS